MTIKELKSNALGIKMEVEKNRNPANEDMETYIAQHDYFYDDIIAFMLSQGYIKEDVIANDGKNVWLGDDNLHDMVFSLADDLLRAIYEYRKAN